MIPGSSNDIPCVWTWRHKGQVRTLPGEMIPMENELYVLVGLKYSVRAVWIDKDYWAVIWCHLQWKFYFQYWGVHQFWDVFEWIPSFCTLIWVWTFYIYPVIQFYAPHYYGAAYRAAALQLQGCRFQSWPSMLFMWSLNALPLNVWVSPGVLVSYHILKACRLVSW